ncbi:helix-turn-helix transcriptional regulator [Burkholderia lata]|uniref:helix-turn-helix transcriptional regulator n=1 Tax=Burkholderia lata (strain ATCC 17760 / DSM 23089 / LMG 22485 / NCIMB 9086 / R18194 / 383) TaxID=482957 RepID=UPI001583AF34|nr:helix-turn-helix transcriptional regulator [Burkholderia lata]
MEATLSGAAIGANNPLDNLIGTIGSATFGECFGASLRALCGAELAFIFRLVDSRPVEFVSIGCDGSNRVEYVRNTYLGGKWWQFDDEINELAAGEGGASRFLKTDFKLSAPPRLRQTLYGQLNIRDRVLMCSRIDGNPLVLSVTRSEQYGPFETRHVDALAERAATMLSIVARHCDLAMRARRLPDLLTDLAGIERQIALAGERLTARESEVCARYLYGLPTSGIAADLGIGTETVVTYRKRLYERLAIGSHRELLLWYLDLCSQLH